MTTYEIIMIILGVLSLLRTLGMLLIALLNFFDKKKDKHK